jgi:hypothetical protein
MINKQFTQEELKNMAKLKGLHFVDSESANVYLHYFNQKEVSQ